MRRILTFRLPSPRRMTYHLWMLDQSVNRRSIAAQEFHRARRQAAIEELVGRLTGHSASLLSYEEVADALQVSGQSSGGLRQVPVAAIIGSVGRYNDFSRTFLPRSDADQDRWVSVKTAAAHIGDLPPVELYRIGDAYFVLDGNHRVSIARRENLEFIDAYVTQIYTRVPLPEGASPDSLIVAAEYAAFLAWTRLDQRRSEIDLQVSVPGQYVHLENHIEASRFLKEMTEEREMDLPEAAARWYDEDYLPLAEAIREQGILRYFPGRTETDFFVWLAAHRNALQTDLGITLSPEATVSRLLDQVKIPDTQKSASLFSRVRRKLGRLSVPETAAEQLQQSQIQTRTVARYTDRLFSDVLVPVTLDGRGVSEAALRQSLALAIEEDGRLCFLGISPEAPDDEHLANHIAELQRVVTTRADALELDVIFVVEQGTLAETTCRLAQYYDLIAVDRSFGAAGEKDVPAKALLDLIHDGHRPVLIAAPVHEPTLASRVLVVLNPEDGGREALFIAAYLGEQRQATVVVVPVGQGRDLQAALDHARAYLEMHELALTVVEIPPATTLSELPSRLGGTASDLLIVSGPSARGRGGLPDEQLAGLIRNWPHSLLIARWT